MMTAHKTLSRLLLLFLIIIISVTDPEQAWRSAAEAASRAWRREKTLVAYTGRVSYCQAPLYSCHTDK